MEKGIDKNTAIGAAIAIFLAGLGGVITPYVGANAVMMVGGVVLLIVALTPSRDWRVLEVPWRMTRGLLGSAAPRHSSSSGAMDASTRPQILEALEASWDAAFLRFCDDASDLWDLLGQSFQQSGFYGSGSGRSGFTKVVGHAAWPDGPDDTTSDAQMLATGAMEDFSARVYDDSGQRTLGDDAYRRMDKTRRAMCAVVRGWSEEIEEGFESEFRLWLCDTVRHPHTTTVKLLWYLERANASFFGNKSPDYEYLRILKDALECGEADGTSLEGWDGLEVGDRYFAWNGPGLHGLEDRSSVPPPPELLQELDNSGIRKSYGNQSELGKYLERGRLPVYETDRENWRRQVQGGNVNQILLVNPSMT